MSRVAVETELANCRLFSNSHRIVYKTQGNGQLVRDGQKPGKPGVRGIPRGFSEHGKRRKSSGNSPASSLWYIGSEVTYFGGWKNLFYESEISRPLTVLARFRRKFCDLYASIYVRL